MTCSVCYKEFEPARGADWMGDPVCEDCKLILEELSDGKGDNDDE
jgi:hypothetical protein